MVSPMRLQSLPCLVLLFLTAAVVNSENNNNDDNTSTDEETGGSVLHIERHTPYLRLGATNNKQTEDLVLPNVLLIGAQKAGSSALGMWLFENGVCRPKVMEGEPSYFDKEVQFFDNPDRFTGGLNFYSKRFEHCRDEIFAMDATPNTLLYPNHVETIYKQAEGKHLQNLKVIVIVREPVARELSLFNHKVQEFMKDRETNPNENKYNQTKKQWYWDIADMDGSLLPFHDYADVVINDIEHPDPKRMKWGLANAGQYVLHLKQWLQFLDRQQLLVISYDEFKYHNTRVENRVRNFLEFDFPGSALVTNARKHKDKVELPHCATVKKLAQVFRQTNQELYQLLQQNPGPEAEQRPFPNLKETDCLEEYIETPPPETVVLPNLLLLGAAEGPHTIGSWLYDAGVCQPEVFEGEPPFHEKEVEFFDQNFRYQQGLEFYAKRFEHCRGKQYALDATPNTLAFPDHVQAIYQQAGEETLQNLKVIAVLREPVSHHRSLFNHKLDEFLHEPSRRHFYWDIRKQDGNPMNFFEYSTQKIVHDIQTQGGLPEDPQDNCVLHLCSTLANGGQYARHLQKWFEFVDRKRNLLVLSFDEIHEEQDKALERIRDFLDFDIPGKLPLGNTLQHRPSCSVQEELDPLFDPLNEDLYKLLEENPGPPSEQVPFPHFKKAECVVV